MSRATKCRAAAFAAVAVFAAACAAPTYGVFEPLRADAPSLRVERPEFSILVPRSFTSVVTGDRGLLARETPPPNGGHLVYRVLDVSVADGVDTEEPAAMERIALESLRARRKDDELTVRDSGATTLGGRDAFFVQGTCSAGAADLRLDVLDFFVPGSSKSLVVQCAIPEGQLAMSRDGFLAIANSLQTKLAPPGAAAGELRWFDGDRVGLRLPEAWQRQPDEEGALAVFVHDPSGARCDLVTKALDGAVELDRVAANYVAEKRGEWSRLRVLSTQRGTHDGRDVLRLRAAYQDGGDTIFVDDTFAVTAGRLDRLLFRVAAADLGSVRAAIDKGAGSLRWQKPR